MNYINSTIKNYLHCAKCEYRLWSSYKILFVYCIIFIKLTLVFLLLLLYDNSGGRKRAADIDRRGVIRRMKCFFNNLVAVRTMELDTNRMKPAAVKRAALPSNRNEKWQRDCRGAWK